MTGFARKYATPAVHEARTQLPASKPPRDCRESRQDTTSIVRLDSASANQGPFVLERGEKLLGQLRGLTRRPGVYPSRAQRCDEAVFLRVTKPTHQNEKVRFRVAAEHIFTVRARLPALESAQEIAALRERCDQCDGRHTTILLCGQKHARIARMDWERQHSSAKWRDGTRNAVATERAEIDEELFSARKRLRVGLFQPAEASDFFDAARFQGQNDLGRSRRFTSEVPGRRSDARAPSKPGTGRPVGQRGRRVDLRSSVIFRRAMC